MRGTGLALAVAIAVVPASVGAETGGKSIHDSYAATAQRLIEAALRDTDGLSRLQYLCDRIGNRLSGSPSLERAIEWSASEMRRAGFENVRTPLVKVPKWVRGKESAVMIEPVQKPLWMIGYGMVPGTPPEGITADVIVVSSPDNLKDLGRPHIAGKIVLFIANADNSKLSYTLGPAAAAAEGAVGVFIRSGFPMQGPHTMALNWPTGATRIPTAALSVEDAAMIQRIVESGQQVRVRLMMEAHQEPDADSHDVMGEIRGREKPDEVVVLGGHIDSWDVGQGAHDDGSGIIGAFEAVALIKKLGLEPRRSIRVVFWVNEENGGAGGRAYREFVSDQVRNHVAAIEDDNGAEKPTGFGFGGSQQQAVFPGAFQRVVDIAELLKSIGADKIVPRGSGGDIRPLTADGVPGFAMRTVGTHYDEWHHTHADSFDNINPRDFQLHIASLAVLSYVLADMPERLTDLK
ncbi:MAG TPA: M20/M25/M40 family metallo-hydrolase [Bryobacteraceae bacterium]|nr:M20/M25/M40 family metallo-hydrolase [Bryobacteraceae bacterium]